VSIIIKMKKKKIVVLTGAVLTGAGISAESGIQTFRDADGLWEGHDVMAVASPEGWNKNQALVLDFYNQRRAQLNNVVPNEAHKALAELEAKYEVCIITQNVDDLHERGGSTRVVHLHANLKKYAAFWMIRSLMLVIKILYWGTAVKMVDNCARTSFGLGKRFL